MHQDLRTCGGQVFYEREIGIKSGLLKKNYRRSLGFFLQHISQIRGFEPLYVKTTIHLNSYLWLIYIIHNSHFYSTILICQSQSILIHVKKKKKKKKKIG